MGHVLEDEQPDTQAGQALSIIANNIDMAAEDTQPICQDTGMPTFLVHTPVGVNQIALKKVIWRRWRRRRGAGSCGRTRWIR